MENTKGTNRIHPLVATAAVSVTLVSLAGVAAITGLLPSSHSTNSPATAPAAQVATATPAAAPNALASNLAASADGKAAISPSERPDAATTAAAAAATEPAAAKKPAQVASNHTTTKHRSTTHTTTAHTSSGSTGSYASNTVAAAPEICASCGRIEAVVPVQTQAKPSGLGVAAGAVVGGLLGNQVGNGNGRTLATIAGAVGGGYAGNEVEKRTHTATTYQVRVRMEDGSVRTIHYASQPGFAEGQRVRVVNDQIVSRG